MRREREKRRVGDHDPQNSIYILQGHDQSDGEKPGQVDRSDGQDDGSVRLAAERSVLISALSPNSSGHLSLSIEGRVDDRAVSTCCEWEAVIHDGV